MNCDAWCYTLSVALLYSRFQIFSFLSPTFNIIIKSTEIWEMLTIPNYEKPNQWFQLEMSTPRLFNPSAIRILSIDFPELGPNSDNILYIDLISASFSHEDLPVTNFLKFARYKFIMYTSKTLILYQAVVIFGLRLTLFLNNLFSTTPIKP